MPVPAQMPEDLKKPNAKGGSRKAPDLVADLKNIKDTLAKLKEANTKDVVPPPSPYDSSNFSAYDVEGGTGASKPNTSSGGFTPPPSDGDKYGSFQANDQAAQKIGNDTPLEHCLVRFVDTSLEGGKVYKYRFRVKMMNPNYSPVPKERKDTYQQFAKEKVLTSAGWAETDLVKVPPDQNVYALKMPEFGAKLNFEMRKEEPWRWTFYFPPRQESNQAAVQIHRWVDTFYPDPTKSNDQRAVGEWLVAARILVERGEFVRDPEYKVPVPVKKPDLNEHELDNNPKPPPRQDKILMPVDFGDETLLIDFEGGDQRYDRTESDGEKVKTVSVLDSTPVELLMMRPDGKMIARNSLVDMNDTKRKDRAEAFTARIEKLRGHGSKTEGDPLKANPK